MYIAGINGMVGSAIAREALLNNFEVIGKSSKELDLRNRENTFLELESEKPDILIMAAAVVGGIAANYEFPVEFLSHNLQIQTNLLDAAHSAGIKKVVFLGSSCIYPKLSPQPIQEKSLMSGPLESSNEAYAIAKIAGIKLVQSYRRQHKHDWISINPSNLYGPGDNFDVQTSHVVPALIRRFHVAKTNNSSSIEIWGDGTPVREFLHVDDLAKGVFQIIEKYDGDDAINIGTGKGISISDLASLIKKIIGFEGNITFNPNFPNGTPVKILNIDKIKDIGWSPNIGLELGINKTYEWFLEHDKDLER